MCIPGLCATDTTQVLTRAGRGHSPTRIKCLSRASLSPLALLPSLVELDALIRGDGRQVERLSQTVRHVDGVLVCIEILPAADEDGVDGAAEDLGDARLGCSINFAEAEPAGDLLRGELIVPIL